MATLRAKVIQYMLSHGCVTADELFAVLGTLRDEGASQLSEDNVGRSIGNLNEKLQMFNMMIRSTYDPKTRQRYYSLISTVDNEIMRNASHHTEKEFEYFRLIWLALQHGASDLRGLHQIGRNLKLPNYKALITEWCAKRWLHMDGDEVSLGPRANAELDVLANDPSTSTQHDSSTQLDTSG